MSQHNNDTDFSKIKPQPYESFEEAERKREEDALAVNPPLSEREKAIVRGQAGINPVEQTVNDALADFDRVHETERKYEDSED